MYVTDLLEKIIKEEYAFCSVCYKETGDEQTNVGDEVILQENTSQKTFKISEIISYVLGDEVYDNVSAFQTICQQCVAITVNSYKFIKTAKENATYTATAIESLAQCFGQSVVPKNMEDCDTLFVTMDPQDLIIGPQYYDRVGPIHSKGEALQKFFAAANLLTPKKEEKTIEAKQNTEFEYREKVKTVDMVHNGDMSALYCKECLKEFPSVSNLRNHFLRVHAPKVFKCTQCPKSFGTKSFLKIHEENHINMVCSECGKTFTHIQTFKSHEKTHFIKIICPDCGRVYKNSSTYKKHLDNKVCQTAVRHSPSEAKFTCDYCGKKYTQKVSLRVHIQYEHLNYKYLNCKWCDKKFWCQARLKAHIVTHTKEKNFICTVCNGKFVSRESLLYHTRIHTGERPYPCPYCDSRFLSASRRQAHLKSQHMNPTIECDICHVKFKSKNYLMKHKYLHNIKTVKGKSLQDRRSASKDDNPGLELDKPVSVQKGKEANMINLEVVQDQKLLYYKVIGDNDNVYKIATDHNQDQETLYLEMSSDGQYNLKVED